MGNKSSLMLQDDEIRQISNETSFSESQIEKLYTRFAHLDRSNCGSLSKHDLLSIPELAINPLCDRLIEIFFSNCSQDERINFRQFLKVLAAFQDSSSRSGSQINHDESRGAENTIQTLNKVRSDLTQDRYGFGQATGSRKTKEYDNLTAKLLFVFKIYDADDDGKISFSDLRNILKMMVGNYIDDVRLDKIATRAFVEVDQDNDGFIDINEFRRVFAGKNLDDKLRVKFFT